jgi:hypothetical protein
MEIVLIFLVLLSWNRGLKLWAEPQGAASFV